MIVNASTGSTDSPQNGVKNGSFKNRGTTTTDANNEIRVLV